MNYADRVVEARLLYAPRFPGPMMPMFHPAGKGRYWRAVASMARPTWEDREIIEHNRNAERARRFKAKSAFVRGYAI